VREGLLFAYWLMISGTWTTLSKNNVPEKGLENA